MFLLLVKFILNDVFFCGSKIQVFRQKLGEVETEIDMLLYGNFKSSDRCGSANRFGTNLNKDA